MKALPIVFILAVATAVVFAMWPTSDPICDYYAEAIRLGTARGTTTSDDVADYQRACPRSGSTWSRRQP